MYEYVHNICYWTGNNRKEILLKHIHVLEKLNKPILCIISLMCDNTENINDYKFLISENKNIDIKILPLKNTGGTVSAMYFVWKYLEKNNINCKYFATWEDDIIPKHINWYNMCISKLIEYTYVGMLTKSNYPVEKYNDKFWKLGYKFIPKEKEKYIVIPSQKYFKYHQMKWTDGGFYFLKFESLKIIETKIGKFTKANVNERYNHTTHGIELGEVGFPTTLSLNGFNFFGFPSDRSWEHSFVEYLD